MVDAERYLTVTWGASLIGTLLMSANAESADKGAFEAEMKKWRKNIKKIPDGTYD